MIQEFLIDDVVVDREIFTVKFVCDIAKCHGICCYAPDDEVVGPPLTGEEAKNIRGHKGFIAEFGIPTEDWHDATKRKSLARTKPITKWNRRLPYRLRLHGYTCIFCSSKGCVLKDFNRRFPIVKVPIDEPVSCSLYPIAEGTDATGTIPFIYVEHYYDERYCKCGYAKGKRENVYLIDFLREPLIRRFGEAFYEHLKQIQKDVLAGKY